MEKQATLEKQVAVLKKDAFEGITVQSDEDLARASDSIKRTIELRKKIEKEKEDYTKPAREIIGKANLVYTPLINALKDAEMNLKRISTNYMMEREKKRKDEEAKIAKKLEDGKIKKPETAVRQIEKLPEAPRNVQGTASSLRIRMVKKLEITDESKLPREFLVPDTTKIKKALDAGIEVPGAHLIEVPSTSSYGN